MTFSGELAFVVAAVVDVLPSSSFCNEALAFPFASAAFNASLRGEMVGSISGNSKLTDLSIICDSSSVSLSSRKMICALLLEALGLEIVGLLLDGLDFVI